jgi:phosphopantothenoylcysteine decarboxylase/phosphopantothenate--cysteine ligase
MHFLITAGGTREYIDPVRFISNASSGKMGYALAEAAKQAGHRVTLISASDFQPPVGVEFIGVDTAAEMFAAVRKLFVMCDCLIMAAAVADYTPVRLRATKIEKSGKDLTLKLKPTKDILAWAGKNKNAEQLVIGFALEDKNLRKRAKAKLREKNLDMIIANTPAAIAAETTSVQVKTRSSDWLRLGSLPKAKVAARLIRLAEELHK